MRRTYWSAIGLIAATYIYFLVFAQFGFLHRVRESLGEGYWNLVLGVMGLTGFLGAIYTLASYRSDSGRRWLMAGFIGAGLGSLLAAEASQLSLFVLSAGLGGFFLSVLTVSLVGVLVNMLPAYRVGLVCGIGTGAAYLFSNVPFVFEASARGQCFIASLVCVGGFLCARRAPNIDAPALKSGGAVSLPWRALIGWLGIFIVLVWSDSAAFTRIQETPALKAASWAGAAHLWSLGIVHFFAAIFAGFLMHTGRWKFLLAGAFAGLLLGWLGLEQGVGGVLSAWVYAGAVSFYSTALVGFALLQARDSRPVIWAGLVYGISGWLGSAMGIGMVNDLGTVPPGFWAVALVFLIGGLTLIQAKAVR